MQIKMAVMVFFIRKQNATGINLAGELSVAQRGRQVQSLIRRALRARLTRAQPGAVKRRGAPLADASARL